MAKTNETKNAPVVATEKVAKVKTHEMVSVAFPLDQFAIVKQAVEKSGLKTAKFIRLAVRDHVESMGFTMPAEKETVRKGRPNAKVTALEAQIAELNATIARMMAKAGEPDTNISSR